MGNVSYAICAGTGTYNFHGCGVRDLGSVLGGFGGGLGQLLEIGRYNIDRGDVIDLL